MLLIGFLEPVSSWPGLRIAVISVIEYEMFN
jgi:hypothetical protein